MFSKLTALDLLYNVGKGSEGLITYEYKVVMSGDCTVNYDTELLSPQCFLKAICVRGINLSCLNQGKCHLVSENRKRRVF